MTRFAQLSVRTLVLAFALVGSLIEAPTSAADGVADPSAPVQLPDAKAVPRMQVIPLPDFQASLRSDGEELTRAYFGPSLRRPFLFPVVGPSGRALTRMGHPQDPEGHSHHNSVWAAHESVNGESFWSDRGTGRIVQRRIVRYDDRDDVASVVSINAWVGQGDRTLMTERRGVFVRPLADREWLMIVDLQFEATDNQVTLGATPFGMFAVRMAKTIGVNEGGGLIRNSEGNVNEQGPNGVFRKRARWVDYSGPISSGVDEGITLLDHPANPNHPSHFHVRNDGWMGASLTFQAPIMIEAGRLLRLRYGLYIHTGVSARRVSGCPLGRILAHRSRRSADEVSISARNQSRKSRYSGRSQVAAPIDRWERYGTIDMHRGRQSGSRSDGQTPGSQHHAQLRAGRVFRDRPLSTREATPPRSPARCVVGHASRPFAGPHGYSSPGDTRRAVARTRRSAGSGTHRSSIERRRSKSRRNGARNRSRVLGSCPRRESRHRPWRPGRDRPVGSLSPRNPGRSHRARRPVRRPGQAREAPPHDAFTLAIEGETLEDVAVRVYGLGTSDEVEALWRVNRDLIGGKDVTLSAGTLLRTP